MACSKNLSTTVPIVLIFTLSVLIVLTFWLFCPPVFYSSLYLCEGNDFYTFYHPVAVNMITDRGFSTLAGQFVTRCPPGYPLIIALAYSLADLLKVTREAMLLTFTILCIAATSVLIYLIANVVFGTVPSLISALVWSTYPLNLWLAKDPNSEVPFSLIFYISFYLFWRNLVYENHRLRSYFLIGILLGIGILIRPFAIGIPIIFGLVFWVLRRKAGHKFCARVILTILLGSILTILPWEILAYLETGKLTMISSAGSSSMFDGLVFGIRDPGKTIIMPPDVHSLMQSACEDRFQLTSAMKIPHWILEQFVNRPMAMTKLYIIKAVRVFYGTDSQRFENVSISIQIIYMSVISCAAFVAWRTGERWARSLFIAVFAVFCYFWTGSMLVKPLVRYMVPSIGLSFVLLPVLSRYFDRG